MINLKHSKNSSFLYLSFMMAAVLSVSCSNFEPEPINDDQTLDGPVSGLTHEQNRQFLAGDIAFNDEIFTSETGLGPVFVATSCVACHAGDGRGTPFTTLTRFGQVDATGNTFLHLGGPQLQNRALPGYSPEQLPIGASFAKFTPPANSGLGFIELVSDADILAMADPDDLDGDGISGVPNWNYIPGYVNPPQGAVSQNGKYICRFGRKGAAFDLLQQTASAYNQDIGITSTFEPVDPSSGLSIDPEVTDLTIRNVVFYLQTLKAPVPRNQGDPKVRQGRELFSQVQCAACHKPQLQTGYSQIQALSYKTFYPYTDLLLHDMGPGLDDGYTEGSAKTYEWRTPPLWGLGLSPNSQGGNFFLMHDGRARSIEQAIQMHSGEAAASRGYYNQLSNEEKQSLLKFLNSL
ncbi:di-heme oxidoredictase family protein [uncultured Flavobacterium sp.]|uniref:di-heme oxidoredictase family protein n=1 Tax=uncultured Flavobacterium sp. TaxID=165435 RepID=UPI0025FE56D1|nr:di-heme oxidoredictase family protein [uncultured Flavobacterium sp.]